MQRDLDDISIRSEFGHLDPVAHANHVVTRDLDTRDQRQNRVAKDQEQDGGHRPYSRHEDPGRSVHQRSEDQERSEQIDEDRYDL